MVRPDLPTDPSSPLRRRLLRAAVLAPLAATLATLPGCSLPVQVDGTFLQPWRSHLQGGPADWQRSLKLAHALGCRQLVLQWTGIVGGSDGDWSLPDSNLQQLFTAASENDIRIRVGLPFQQRWWQAIGADDATLQDWAQALQVDVGRSSPSPARPATATAVSRKTRCCR